MTSPDRNESVRIVFGDDLHSQVVLDGVLQAKRTVWVATANLKDMHIEKARGYSPILETFDRMASKGVRFRVIHCDLPSRPFRKSLDRCTHLLSGGMELQICPRSHWKMIIVDGRFAYLGSANFTGAGLGAKKASRRNLELGITTDDPGFVNRLSTLFDQFWIGEHCRDCAFKKQCPDPIDS